MDHPAFSYADDWSRWKDPDIPKHIRPTDLLLKKHLKGPLGQRPALIADGRKVSYQALYDEVEKVAAGLLSLGARKGERLLFFATDSVAFVATWFACVHIGVVPVVVSNLYKAEQLLYFLSDTEARLLFIDGEMLDKLRAIEGDLPSSLSAVIVHQGEAGAPFEAAGGWIPFSDLTTKGRCSSPEALHPNDLAYMFYSGGTTGTAKGVTHLAHDFILVPERHGAFWEYGPGDVVYATSKKYFTHGLWPGVLIPFYFGAAAIITGAPPSADAVWKILTSERPTVFVTVPTVIKNLLYLMETKGLQLQPGRLRLAVTASEKVPDPIFERFYQRFGVELFDSIGSSELTYEWIANRPKEYKRGSLGRPVFGVRVRLVDDDGQDVQRPGEPGEAWIQTKTACFYYWKKFEETKNTFVGPWTRTGDVLSVDEDGFFWFSSRKGDIFKVKGLWVSPIEVENAIMEHDKVLEAAVVPMEDKDGLTKAKAFVVLHPGESASSSITAAIRENVRRIGGYKIPEEIVYVDALPKTTLLKIDRRALRAPGV